MDVSWWGQGSVCDKARCPSSWTSCGRTTSVSPSISNRTAAIAAAPPDDDPLHLIREYGERRRWDTFLLLEDADGSARPVFKSFRTILPPTFVDCMGRTLRVPDFATTGEWRQQTDTDSRAGPGHPSITIVLLADSLDFGEHSRRRL